MENPEKLPESEKIENKDSPFLRIFFQMETIQGTREKSKKEVLIQTLYRDYQNMRKQAVLQKDTIDTLKENISALPQEKREESLRKRTELQVKLQVNLEALYAFDRMLNLGSDNPEIQTILQRLQDIYEDRGEFLLEYPGLLPSGADSIDHMLKEQFQIKIPTMKE